MPEWNIGANAVLGCDDIATIMAAHPGVTANLEWDRNRSPSLHVICGQDFDDSYTSYPTVIGCWAYDQCVVNLMLPKTEPNTTTFVSMHGQCI